MWISVDLYLAHPDWSLADIARHLELHTSTVVTPFGNTRRNRFNAYWQTKPEWLQSGWLRVELNENLNNFADNTRNFNERLLKATLQIDIEKRASDRGTGK